MRSIRAVGIVFRSTWRPEPAWPNSVAWLPPMKRRPLTSVSVRAEPRSNRFTKAAPAPKLAWVPTGVAPMPVAGSVFSASRTLVMPRCSICCAPIEEAG